jgi:hypothetical protein
LTILIPPTAPHSIRGWQSRPNSGQRAEWARSHPKEPNKTEVASRSGNCFHDGFSPGSFSYHEDGCYILHRNASSLSTDYADSFSRRWHFQSHATETQCVFCDVGGALCWCDSEQIRERIPPPRRRESRRSMRRAAGSQRTQNIHILVSLMKVFSFIYCSGTQRVSPWCSVAARDVRTTSPVPSSTLSVQDVTRSHILRQPPRSHQESGKAIGACM